MADWTDVLGKALGVSSQLGTAAAVYGFFSFLDKKASNSAKTLLTKWIEGEARETIDARKFLSKTFDRIYGSSLLKLKALCVSMVFSISSLLIWWVVAWLTIGNPLVLYLLRQAY